MAGSLLGSSALLFLCVLCSPLNAQIDCGPPPRREREELADLSVKESYSHNEYVLYNCRPGYIKVGRFRLKCNNGRWDETPPYIECKKKPCGHPGDIQSGSFELVEGEDFSFGARVEYRCEEGYKMLSHTNYRECRADGWSNDVPHCEITKCFPVREPKNGRILMTGIMDLNQDFPYGHLLQFECNDPFKIKGSNQIVCTSDGTWSADVPTCVEITCEPPNIAHGGVRNSKTIYRNGERIQISCDDGYKPADREDATCTRDGWNTRVECTAVVCRQPQIDNGNIQPKQLLYQYQESIDTSCDEGYRNTDTSFCTDHGWQPPPACIPKHCEYPHVQNGGVYESESSFPKRPGSTIYFSCDNGFLPENKRTWHLSYCTIRGWEPKPKCFRICDSPRRIPHGYFNYYQRPLIEGNVISYKCDTGYVPENQQTTTCTKNGWLPTPSCVAQVLEIPLGCQKTPLPNGFFTARKEVFSVSEKVRYQCHRGYTTPNRVEEEEIQCLRTGWNREPKCIKTCQKPNEANVDFVEKESFFLSQETLHYKCKDGFQVSKTAVDGHIQCKENGWDSLPVCVAIECDVPILGNGSIEGKDQYANRDVVKFSCKKGYSRVGPDSSQCYYFGWSPQPPVCKETVKSCQQPLSISNGTVVGDLLEEYQHGKKLFYECDIGFVMSGSNTVECVDGEWTSLPSCTEEVKFCRKPQQIKNGRTVGVDSNSDRYGHNETVKYECSPTYFLVGTNPARCLHGKWKLPECRKQCKRPEGITFERRVSHLMYFNNNTVINYICGDHQHETKCVNGKWFPEPECTELCPPPPQLPNAINITETRNYKNGEEVGFTCMEHFLLQGPPKISCEYGRWQTPPRCIDQRCENPPSIDNGEVENISQNKYLPGETVEYHCLEGFEISGPSFATCGNAIWQKLPACNEKMCGQPPLIDNASFTKKVKNRYQSGETVNYECHPGFAAEGPLILTCQRGEWSESSTCEDVTCGEPPLVANGDIVENRDSIVVNRDNIYLPGQELHYECHKDFEISGRDTIKCENQAWSKPPTCEDMSCPPPPDILHGRLRGNRKPKYSPNESVQYQCDNGYYISGSRIVKCLKKEWSEAPQCRVNTGKCDRPPSIENGDITDLVKQEYKSGEYVTYKCQRYHNMDGNAVVRCQNGRWSDTPKCIEPCTASEEDMERNNIRLRWSWDEKIYSKDGDITEFTCKRGYPVVPLSQFRVRCVNGTFEYPRCE
ncbi:complement factor H isoform X1 [Anolis sagrei]|uniref:complement factor H isoform X1 n=1 Tax=Anolis sagrei TaxID=38937 RepID=UPI00352151A1